jgi:hypothetical protein
MYARTAPSKWTFRDKCAHIKEETVQLANGKICQLLIQTSPIINTEGGVDAVIEMSTNITEVKKGQKELKTLEIAGPCSNFCCTPLS